MALPLTDEQLYQLLPAIHRTKDAIEGQPLRALLAVIDEQRAAVEADVAGLYENWFIETCADWVVPYIADLLGAKSLELTSRLVLTRRALTANTLRHQRRKGTATTLEHLAFDMTGWPARVVEFFEDLSATQNLYNPLPENLATPTRRPSVRARVATIRHADQLDRVGGAFDDVARNVDVRRVASARGKHNIPSVGVFLWRLQAFPVTRSPAAAAQEGPGLYRMSPLGDDAPLFNPLRSERPETGSIEESDVPGPLRRLAVYRDLQDHGTALAASLYFSDPPAFEIFVDDTGNAVPPSSIVIRNLETWRRPPAGSPVTVAVDPVLGRLAFPSGWQPPGPVLVSYYQGFSDKLGGGGYHRAGMQSPDPAEASTIVVDTTAWQVGATVTSLSGGGAVSAAFTGSAPCLVRLQDSGAYSLSALQIPAGQTLIITAANRQRPLLDLSALTSITMGDGSRLLLEGLLLHGGPVTLAYNGAGAGPDAVVAFLHCTLVPGGGLTTDGAPTAPNQASIAAPAGMPLTVLLQRTISGRLSLPLTTSTLTAEDSIIDGAGGTPDALQAWTANIQRCTVFGSTTLTVLDLASDSIFVGALKSEQRQDGCLRYSYLGPGSATTQSYSCQLADAGAQPPAFTSVRHGAPSYAQLARSCPDAIRSGGSNESEMGAFNRLYQPQQESQLQSALAEYVRLGSEAGIFFVT